MSSISREKEAWIFVVPINGLELTKTVNYEFRVDKVTFISAEKLATRRKRFGLPDRISTYRKPSDYNNDFFTLANCFAVIKTWQTGELKDIENNILELIREELAILNLSQLGYSRRNEAVSLSVSKENLRVQRNIFVMSSTGKFPAIPSYRNLSFRKLRLGEDWKRFQKGGFFFDLIRIIRGEIEVDKNWRTELRNAAIIAGQSQTSKDLPHAFLWNVIVLEMLLPGDREKMKDVLPSVAEAFLGWIENWEKESFAEKIEKMYNKRSSLVHRGKRKDINHEDLFFTDELLLNIFINIITHHKIFKSRQSVIEFAKKRQAERVLGINAKVRPKTLRHLRRLYSEQDFKY